MRGRPDHRSGREQPSNGSMGEEGVVVASKVDSAVAAVMSM